MSKPSRGLGRGLESLLQSSSNDAEIDEKEKIHILDISEITPNKFQPRREFDEETLEELMQSIKQYGVLQPVLARKTLDGYELIAGERRLRASSLAGLKTIPAMVREYSDAEMTEIALIENLQREDLTAIEEALAYNKLLTEFGLTQEELSKKVGRSRSHIANFIRLLSLPKVIQDYVSRGTISMGQAKPLISLEKEEMQIEAAEYIIAEDLSARDAEDFVKKMAANPNLLQEKEDAAPKPKEIFVVEAEDKLKFLLGTHVKIKPGKLKSKIEIEFYSAEDLDRIVDVLSNPGQQQDSKSSGKFIV